MTGPLERTRAERGYGAFIERVALPLGDLALRTEFMRELRRWRHLQTLSRPELDRIQREGLARLLSHASSTVPSYRDLGVEPSEDPHEWLRRFPILTKADLRKDGDRMITPGARRLVKVASSGSSGVQSILWATPAELSRSLAIQTLWWEWVGYRLGDRLLQTGITPDRGIVKRQKDRLLRTTYVPAFGLTDAEVAAILARGVRRPWRFVGGYASSLASFARTAHEQQLDAIAFDGAISWGDKLYDRHRRIVARQFGTQVLDTYGASEGVMIAAEHPGGPYLVMSPHVVVELLDDDGEPVPPGEMGHVVVTRLDALTMPLIRFRLGDLAVAPAEPVTLPGLPAFPQLERIIGRETDVLTSPGGRTLTVHTFTGVFEHVEAIEQFAVVPTPTGITIEYIAGDELPATTLDDVERDLNDAVGERLPISWTRVMHIPDTPSGKPQIIRHPPQSDLDGDR